MEKGPAQSRKVLCSFERRVGQGSRKAVSTPILRPSTERFLANTFFAFHHCLVFDAGWGLPLAFSLCINPRASGQGPNEKRKTIYMAWSSVYEYSLEPTVLFHSH